MKSLLKIELSKALKNKFFYITLLAATVVSVLCAMNRISEYNSILKFIASDREKYGGTSFTNPYLPADSVFTYWIGGDYTSVYFSIFYLLLPLFAAFPYGWSYITELKKGYVKNVVTRAGKTNYYVAKYIAVFVAGGLAVLIPLIVNFCTVASFIPARTPDVLYDTYNGVPFTHMWSELFYTHPFVYVGLYMALNFVFSGLIATLSIAVAFAVRNRVAALITPLFLMLCMNFANTYSTTWELSPLNFLHSGIIMNPTNGYIVLAEGLVLFAVTFGITLWRGRKNEIF